MGDRISNDPQEMRRIEAMINQRTGEFNKLYKEVLSLLERKIGAEYNPDRAWWGNNARNFMKDNVEGNMKPNFEIAERNIDKLKKNLHSQIEAWEKFEGL